MKRVISLFLVLVLLLGLVVNVFAENVNITGSRMEQIKKEINSLTIAYAIFISSMSGFMADMYLSLPISIFIACCILYVIYLLIRFLSPLK